MTSANTQHQTSVDDLLNQIDNLDFQSELQRITNPEMYQKRLRKSTLKKPRMEDEPEVPDCDDCLEPMSRDIYEDKYVCPACRTVQNVVNNGEYTIGASENYNVSSRGHMPFKMTGPNSRVFQAVLRKSTSDTPQDSYLSKIVKIIARYNYQCSELTLSEDLIMESALLFEQLQQATMGDDGIMKKNVKRGMNRKGLIAACIQVACQKAGLDKKISDVAKLMKVTEKKVSVGHSTLLEFHNIGVVDIPQNVDATDGYLRAMVADFKIPQQYRSFLGKLVKRTVKYRLGKVPSCEPYTRCAGAVFLLGTVMQADAKRQGIELDKDDWRRNIDHEHITQFCDGISRGTYLHMQNAVVENPDVLRKLFQKYDVPEPKGWPAEEVDKTEKK